MNAMSVMPARREPRSPIIRLMDGILSGLAMRKVASAVMWAASGALARADISIANNPVYFTPVPMQSPVLWVATLAGIGMATAATMWERNLQKPNS